MTIDKLERNNRRLDAASPAASSDAADRSRDIHGVTQAAQPSEALEQYDAELTARFQAYVDWAIDHWPAAAAPPDQSSFARSREELNLLRRRAGLPANGDADPAEPGGAQFVSVTPMPWP